MMNRAQGAACALVARYREHDPEQLAERLGILVLDCDLPDSVEGFYQCMEQTKIIYLNERLPYYRRRVVCGHELGHAVLHGQVNSLLLGWESARLENEADLFCAELLLSSGECEENDIGGIVRATGLPERAVRMRYHQI